MTEAHTQLRPNVWLTGAGLRAQTPDGSTWKATFQALGGCAFLRVQEPAASNVAAVRGVLDDLPRGVRAAFRIVERAELEALGSDPVAPFALAAAPGFVLDQRADGAAMQPNPGMSHGHHPEVADMDTGLIAAGAGVRAGESAPRLELTSLAPFVAALLDVELEAADGALYPGLLDD